jgi:hypothetical protein
MAISQVESRPIAVRKPDSSQTVSFPTPSMQTSFMTAPRKLFFNKEDDLSKYTKAVIGASSIPLLK